MKPQGKVLPEHARMDRMGMNAMALEAHVGWWSPVLVSVVTGEDMDVVDRFATAGVAGGHFRELVSGGPSRHLSFRTEAGK